MKAIFKKILPVLIVAFALVATFAVTALATDYSWVGDVTLLDMSQSGVVSSKYTDIDGNAEWTQVGAADYSKAYAFNDCNFYWTWNFNAYYNSTTKTLVCIPSYSGGIMSARSNGTPIMIGEGTISDLTGIDERYYAEKWANAGVYAYYVHSFELWLDEFGSQVETVEFRPYQASTTATGIIAEQFGAYVADDLTNLKTVKMTPKFSFRSAGDTADKYNKVFENKASLTTVQQGTFAAAGTYTATTPANAVTLVEGPKTDTKYGVSNVIFSGCSSITRVIIESNTANYVGLRNNMFNGCTSLKFVCINVAMSDAYLVGADAFTGCSGVNVYVDNTANATALAAVSEITLKTLDAYDTDLKEYFSKNAPIYADGVLIKIADNATTGENVALRFIFRWDAANTPAAGTPVKVGVVACAADYYDGIGGTLEAEKLAALLADTNTKKVKKNDIAVYDNGKMSLVGKFLADGTDAASGIYSYAYTLYGIPSANYDSEVYAATYIEWDDGTYSIASNSYTDSTSATKNTISLYDVTLGLFKQGLINSEKVDDKYLWDVLKVQTGAVHGQTNNTSASSGINAEYYYLPDNIDGGYVLAHKAITKYADDGVTLKGATLPHNVNYGQSSYKAHSDKYALTHTIVVDHGVTAFGGARVFGPAYVTTAPNTSIKTIVYPNGVDATLGTHFIQLCQSLSNIIWCHTDENGQYVPHMSDITWNSAATDMTCLYDLRGFGATITSSHQWNFALCYAMKNVILASDSTMGSTNVNGVAINVWKES